MEFGFTEEQQKLKQEVIEFLQRELTEEFVKESKAEGRHYGYQASRGFGQKLGARGWLTPTWPKEYGGLESSEVSRFLVYDELYYSGAPCYFIGATMVGPTILRYGSEELKTEYLPKIAGGQIEFALGYTEPNAGSDLGALGMRAIDKGDHFLVSGQKTFNTHCHVADYHWLAVRTDPDVSKHKGISLLIVDMKTPGITIGPLWTIAGYRTNEAYYDNVRVPKENLVGEMNRGWEYLMIALGFERIFPMGAYRNLYDRTLQYAREKMVDGKPLGMQPLIRHKLAQCTIDMEVSHLLYYRIAHCLDKGETVHWQAAVQKMFMTETCQRLARIAMEILGLYGQLTENSKWAVLNGEVKHHYLGSVVETIYGGSSEIQRDIIASLGLGLPRN
jgi:alkylation response protein AidB-like acyl-CoA dehydrogenase